jgi:hypothetical protein
MDGYQDGHFDGWKGYQGGHFDAWMDGWITRLVDG